MKINYYRMLLATVLVVIMQSGNAVGNSSDPGFCMTLLPKDTLALINEKYADWRILVKDDLLSDDQMLWEKNHERECPGIAIGQYEHSGVFDYALLIIPKKVKKMEAKLLMLRKRASGKFSIEVLYEDKDITSYPVIYKSGPGQYFYFYDSKKSVEVPNDVVIYEHIEASAIVFYYMGGKYHQLLISD